MSEKEQKLYIKKLPKEISVSVFRSKDGGFCAEISLKNGDVLRTQAEGFPEIIVMVNDAIYTYFEIPKEYLSYMLFYIPPVEVAQELKLYPSTPWRSQTVLTNT